MVRVSVEISTYNRRPVLERVLERLAAQTLAPGEFEVIVSDDGSTDGTQAWLLEYAKRSPYRLTLVQNEHSGPGGTHNQGILRAQGEIVQMLADDVLATPGLLEHHLRMHERHPDPAVAVVGSLEQSPEMPDTAFQRAWNALLGAMYPRNRVELGYRDFWVNNLSF
jgi:glycosyltransferase involved in cell wall biosynthesis